jgi:hypothetical protein
VDPDEPSSRRRYLTYGIGGGGGVLIGTSLLMGAVTRSRWNEAQAHCRERLCDQSGVDLAHSAHSLGTASTVVFVAGTAALAAGVYLYLTAPHDDEREATGLRLVPGVGPSQVGFALQGGF